MELAEPFLMINKKSNSYFKKKGCTQNSVQPFLSDNYRYTFLRLQTCQYRIHAAHSICTFSKSSFFFFI